MRCTEAFVDGDYRRRRILTLVEIFTCLKQGNILDRLFALVNGHFKISRECGRCLLLRMGRVRNNNIHSSSKGLSSSSKNDLLLNFFSNT
jgi:hypothetical protein